MRQRLKVAVFLSGGGTTLKNLLQRNRQGQIDVDFRLVISSNNRAKGIQIAADAAIPTKVIRRKSFDTAEEHSEAFFQACRDAEVDYVLMGGFLTHVLIPADFENKVLNTHPALIPSFCGKGYYGERVHQAVLDYGAKITGCTIHFVDNDYDHGPIVLQKTVTVLDEDTADSLAARVFSAECEAYPETINLIADGRVRVEGRRVFVTKTS